MTTESQFAALQLQNAYDGDAWYGPSLTSVLEGITAEQAARKLSAHAHSIWELVLHIASWEEIFSARLQGERIVDVPPERDFPPIGEPTEAAWLAAQARLRKATEVIKGEVANFPVSRWDETVPGKQYSFRTTLHGMVQHNVYHTGQIALLKKLLR